MVAAAAGVGSNTIAKVKSVKAKADPAIQEMARTGEVSINAAEKVSRLPAEQQKKIASEGPAAVKKAAAVKPVPSVPVDQNGTPLPDNSMIRIAFECGPKFDECIQSVSNIKSTITRMGAAPTVLVNINQITRDLDNVAKHLKAARPYAVCPGCKASGKPCNGCKQRGWVGKHEYNNAPSEMKVPA